VTVPFSLPLDKPRLVAANKIDALDDPERLVRLESHVRQRGIPLYKISGVTGEGIPPLLEAMWAAVSRSSDGTNDTGEEAPRAVSSRD
jgi:GTP-binding protein